MNKAQETKCRKAAEAVASKLRGDGHIEVKVWSPAEIAKYGWGGEGAGAAVVCEGADLAEMQIWGRGPWTKDMNAGHDVFMEPVTSWMVAVYEA